MGKKSAKKQMKKQLKMQAKQEVANEAAESIGGNGQGYGRYGASTDRRSMMGWVSSLASPIEDIERNIATLRSRSRDLYMGAPIAGGAVKTMVTNVVGPGLRLNANIDKDFLRMSADEADAWETHVEREFKLWSEAKTCDAARMNNFYELQALSFLSFLMSGDTFALLPFKKRVGMPYELTVQLLEADRVCSPNNTELFNDEKIVNGVEIDKFGEVVAYHIADKHPKALTSLMNKWVRVEKYGKKSGRVNVLHLINMERPEQRRGVPFLAPVIETLKQLSRYSDAELMAAVISGMYTLFITSESPNADAMGGGLSPDDEIDFDGENDDIQVGNGAVNFLQEGEKIQESNPGRPNTAFDGFVTSMCRQIGVALEIPYEVLMKHFTSSYSASRGALLEAWKMFRVRRTFLATNFCQPIYEEFLAEGIAKGRIYAPNFFTDPAIRKAYCGAEWNGPTQGQLDPLKEVNAAEKRVEGGFSTRTREAMELTGTNFFENHDLREREEAVRRAAGLDSASIKVVPVAQPIDDDDDSDEDDEQ